MVGFIRLVLGHWQRFRNVQLQETATSWLRQPTPVTANLLRLVNLSIAIRALGIRAYLAVRARYSRFRWSAAARRLALSTARDAETKKSLLCPSRGRPDGASRLIRSVAKTARHPAQIELIFYVDDDDAQLPEYRAMLKSLSSICASLGRVELLVGPSQGVSKAWNVMAQECCGDFLMMANDDQIYADYGWDTALDHHAEQFPDKVVALFFDGGQYADGSTDFPIIHRRWYEHLGYYCPEQFNFWFNEAWIFDLADRLGRIKRIPGVLVQHFHYQDYTAVFDDTYRRHRMSYQKSLRDREIWDETETERIQDSENCATYCELLREKRTSH